MGVDHWRFVMYQQLYFCLPRPLLMRPQLPSLRPLCFSSVGVPAACAVFAGVRRIAEDPTGGDVSY
jgi:hypothetical protein